MIKVYLEDDARAEFDGEIGLFDCIACWNDAPSRRVVTMLRIRECDVAEAAVPVKAHACKLYQQLCVSEAVLDEGAVT